MQSSSDSIKLLQITDTHLFAADEGSLLSVKTVDSFNAVVADVLRRNVAFDYILATGDISQDHSAESYQRFANGIEPLEKDSPEGDETGQSKAHDSPREDAVAADPSADASNGNSDDDWERFKPAPNDIS